MATLLTRRPSVHAERVIALAAERRTGSGQPVLFLATELSRKRWVIAAHLAGADKVSMHEVRGC